MDFVKAMKGAGASESRNTARSSFQSWSRRVASEGHGVKVQTRVYVAKRQELTTFKERPSSSSLLLPFLPRRRRRPWYTQRYRNARASRRGLQEGERGILLIQRRRN